MSYVDPQEIEQTKRRIRQIVGEISDLAKKDLSPGEYFGEFLTRVVAAEVAIGGAVWTIGDGGGLDLAYQINLRETRLAENEENLARHGLLLQKSLTANEGLLVAPHSGEGEDGQAANPTDFLLVLSPVRADREIKGVVEIFQRPGAAQVQRGWLQFLLQMCELAGEYLKTRQLRHFSDRQTLWNQLENFTRVAHASLDPREAAYTIANEGRRLVECDRVSVAIKKGRKCSIEAVSGQDTFDKRSNTISLLNRLATAVVATGDPLWYSGDTRDLAPQVETAVQEYVDDSHSKNVAVLPLKRQPKTTAKSNERAADEEAPGETIGALIVELIEDARMPESMVSRVNVVAEHSSMAMANALEHQSLFLMPVWRAIGKSKWIVKGRALPKTIAVLIAVAALVAAMILVPWDFYLAGDGKLQPIARRNVFAQVEGHVVKVVKKHKDWVEKGEVLVELSNPDLDEKEVQLSGEYVTKSEERTAINRKLQRGIADDGKRLTTEQRDEFTSKLIQLDALLASLEKQKELIEEKRKRLQVTSPIAGSITTWDVDKKLQGRTVRPGQILMEISQLAGEDAEYELEVFMPEEFMGHVARAQEELGEDLPVKYRLAVAPGKDHYGKVREVHLNAEVKGEGENTVLTRVKIDTKDIRENLRPGADVKAKVYCGRRPVGFVLFHSAFAWVQKQLFKFF